MKTCEEVILTKQGLRVCASEGGAEHSHHDSGPSRDLLPGEIVVLSSRDESLVLITDHIAALIDILRLKAEAGQIAWSDDAPILWGCIEEIEQHLSSSHKGESHGS